MIKRMLATVILFFTLFLLPRSVYGYTQSEIIQRIDSDVEAVNSLSDSTEAVKGDANAILEILARDIPSVVRHLDESSNFYALAILSETDEELKAILTNIDNDIKGLSSSLVSVEESMSEEDEDKYTNAFTQFDSYIESLNSDMKLFNDHFGGGVDYSWLAWPFWMSLIISIVLFMMSRGNPVLPAEQLRNKFEFALFKSSLWPLGGSAISYFWFLGTPPGGTFYLLWGPIGIGFFQFFKGLYAYITLARPAINLAKKEQQAKLEALITSDKFQKESLEEQVKEIEKRRPFIHLGKKDK